MLTDIVALQRERWLLWLAPALIAGAALWLTWPTDPPLWLGGAIFLGAGSAAWALGAWPSAHAGGWGFISRRIGAGALALIAAAGLGAAAAQARTLLVAQPAFEGGEETALVQGWVLANDASENGPRLRMLVHDIEGISHPPVNVRVAVADAGVLTPGRAARCRAVLGTPSGPLAPGGYDFARRAFFERLGATGFAYGRCRAADFAAPRSWWDRALLKLAAFRSDLSAVIVEAAPARGGALAAALVTGDRSPMDQTTIDALQNSGLGHLVSVSGIHMGVVGGLVFAVLLWTLSLIAPLALRWPVKKIAAIAALVVLALYLVISGSSVPALRAFVMACVAFGAIVLDRPAISMRGLALAAFVVVLLFPESVLEAGFQMSFAATMALVALFEMMKRAPHEPALPTPGPLIGALNSATHGIGSVLLISLVAGLATDPFAIYHFQRFSLYALPANLIVAPIMSFLVAPAAGAAAILAPFGLADPALEVMASALDLVVAVGAVFGDRPEAVRALPQPPELAFLLCVAALTWGCLWRGALRWGALILFAASAFVYAMAPRPVAAFDSDLRTLFTRNDNGWTLINRNGRSSYARDRLGAMLGISAAEAERLPLPQQCSDLACLVRTRSNHLIAMVFEEAGFQHACEQGAVVLTRLTIDESLVQNCKLGALIDATNLAQQGGAFVYEDATGLSLSRASDPSVRRPWTPRAPPQTQE